MAQARSELPADGESSDERSPEHPRQDVPYDASAKPSLGNVVRLERRSMPTWLKVILLLVHLLPLVLIAVSSGVLQIRHVARALFVLLALVAVAELVDNAILAPLYGRDACLLLLVRGMVLEPADEKMFQSWARRKFSRAQCLLIVSWAVWWNLYHRLVPWGLVPNVIVCALATRAFFRERREFEDIEGLELCLSWACAVGTASLNTVAFLAAPPARRSMYIELELLTDAELYSTFAVVGQLARVRAKRRASAQVGLNLGSGRRLG